MAHVVAALLVLDNVVVAIEQPVVAVVNVTAPVPEPPVVVSVRVAPNTMVSSESIVIDACVASEIMKLCGTGVAAT